MGFFSGLGKVIQGQPVFDPNGQPQQPDQQQNQPTSNILPLVQIRRVECHEEGNRMDVYADIHNDSNAEVYIDRIRLLGTTVQLDHSLHPGQAQQSRVYSGPRPNNNQQEFADVEFKTMDGKYFNARHIIRYKTEADGTYSITEFLLQSPIRPM